MSTTLEDMEFIARAAFSEAFRGMTPESDARAGADVFSGPLGPLAGRNLPRAHSDEILGAAVAVDVRTSAKIERHVIPLRGVTAEFIDITGRERVDIRFRGEVHLLVVHEQGYRLAGETSAEGATCSTQRDLSRKLTFVPAGHAYHEWIKGGSYPQAIYFYIDPAKLATGADSAGSALAARLLFEDTALWETALKFRDSLDASGPARPDRHLEALGVVLACELQQLTIKAPRVQPLIRGGLAAWQQRVVAKHIDENLGERLSVSALAALVHLSPYHFCRAFKQSFGQPPHRYHIARRIQRAKALLEAADYSVTEIGMTLGFSETSSFCTAFRKATGLTPTAYHRRVA